MSINIIPFNDTLFSLENTDSLLGCNGRNYPFNTVAGLDSKTNYTFRIISAPKTNVIQLTFDENRSQVRHTGLAPNNNLFGDFLQPYDPRVNKNTTTEGEIGFLSNINDSNYKVYQLDNSTGKIFGKGTALRWIPSNNYSSLYLQVEENVFSTHGETDGKNAGVVFQNYDTGSSFVSWGSSIDNIYDIENVYLINSSQNETSIVPPSGVGYGIIPPTQNGVVPVVLNGFTPSGSPVSASGYIFVKETSSGLTLTVHITSTTNDISDLVSGIISSLELNSEGIPCFSYNIDVIVRLDVDSNTNSFKRIVFKESGYIGTQYEETGFPVTPKVYQWDYTSIDVQSSSGSDEAERIEGEVYSWIPAESALYLRQCTIKNFEIRFGAVIQYTTDAIFGHRGFNLSKTNLTEKTTRFINLVQHLSSANSIEQENRVYSDNKQYFSNWIFGGETLAQTLNREISYVPGFDYIPGQKIIQVHRLNENDEIQNYQYSLGTVISWTTPDVSNASDFGDMKLVARIDKKGPRRPGSVFGVEDFDNLQPFKVGSLVEENSTEGIFPENGKIIPYTTQVLEDLKRNPEQRIIYPNWPYNINIPGNVFFSSQKNGIISPDTGTEEFLEKSETPKPTTFGTSRIRCISLNPTIDSSESYPLYKAYLFDVELFENDNIFGDLTHIAYRHFESGETDITKTFAKRIIEIAPITGKKPTVESFDGEFFITRKTKIFEPTNDKMFIELTTPVSDNIFESVISGGNFLDIQIQKIYNVFFNGNQLIVSVNVDSGSSPVSSNSRFLIEEPGINWYAINSETGETLDLYFDKTNLENNELLYSLSNDGKTLTLTRTSSTSGEKLEILLIAKVFTNVNINNIKTKQITTKKESINNALFVPTKGKYKGKYVCEFMKEAPFGTVQDIQSIYLLDSSGRVVFGTQNLKNEFELDLGITDQKISLPKLIVKSSNITPNKKLSSRVFGTGSESLDPNSVNLEITYTIYEFINPDSAGIHVKESYDQFSLEDIPFYTSPNTGKVYHDSSIIDFRPNSFSDISEQTLGNTKFVPHPDWSSTIKTSFYLPRKDRLILTSNGKFEVIYGVPSINPVYPQEPTNSMSLNLMQKPPYVFSVKNIEITELNNKRYTMKDIGKLEKRVEKLEYFTKLSVLEAEADSFLVTDENGISRLKSSILVDSFSGHNIGDILNPDYNVSIDQYEKYCRAPYILQNFKCINNPIFISDSSKFIPHNKNNGFVSPTNIFTFPYILVPFASQPLASKSVSVVSGEISDWNGILDLIPSSDVWVNTKNPEVLSNVLGINQGWLTFGTLPTMSITNPYNAHWNSWQSIGKTKIVDFVSNNSSNVSSFTSSEIISNNIETFNNIETTVGENLPLIPFIKNQTIMVVAKRLKPNTRMYVFFDGFSVSEFSKSYPSYDDMKNNTNGTLFSTGSSANLSTNFDGTMFIRFDIPEGIFKTGEKIFDLIDNSSNDKDESNSYCSAKYFANGLGILKEENIVTTRDFKVQNPDEIQQKNPLSQTFFVNEELHPEGIYIKSIDLFFQSKPINDILSVSVDLRPIENSIPSTTKIYPGSLVCKKSLNVNISQNPDALNSLTKTTFEFDYPIYLEPGEHAVCVYAQSEDFKIYIAELGENIIGTDIVITTQPNSGNFYYMNNTSNISPIENVSLMLVMNKCQFETNKEYLMSLRNESIITPRLFETFYIQSNYVDFNSCRLNWSCNLYPIVSSNEFEEINVLPNTNNLMQKQYSYGKINNKDIPFVINIKAETTNGDVCPLIDLERFGVLTIHNIIDSNDSENNGETLPYSDSISTNKRARYISKTVTIEEGFESTNLKVIVSLNKPKNTNIQLFAKTQSAYSTEDFHSNNYTLLRPTKDSYFNYISKNDNDYQTFVFELPSESTEPFNKYCVKICLYSSDSIHIPKIKDLRTITVI